MTREVDKEVELGAGERDLVVVAVAPHAAARDIDLERTEPQRTAVRARLTRPAGPAPQRGADAGDQLGHLERLADVVVGARLETDHDIERVGSRGQHHDRDGRGAADLAGDLEAVHPRQHDVEQHEVDAAGKEPVEPGATIVRGLQLNPAFRRPMAVTSRIDGSSSTSRIVASTAPSMP